MKELREIIKAYDSAKLAGKECVLATVVHLEGSSYRRPGARMLVLDDGVMIGAISGGCLEGDALKKALLTFAEKKSRVVTYDTSDEDEATIGVQLGCEGVIQVLFEYIDPSNKNNPLELLRKVLTKRQAAVLVILYQLDNRSGSHIGTCLLQDVEGTKTERIPLNHFSDAIDEDIRQVFKAGKSVFSEYKSEEKFIHAFIEYLPIPISLVLVGAGNDAIPVMHLAAMLGWEVKVVDGRKTHAQAERFASACQVLVSRPEAVLEQIQLDSRTAFVLMTHNYVYDLKMLKALLGTPVPYIGLQGPKKKLTKMLDQLKQEGIEVTEQQLSRIFGPVGLDIGAETPDEIAASIIAEIQAVFQGKEGQMLKWKNEVIHSSL